MYKAKFVQDSEANKILWDLEIQMDHSKRVRRSDLVLINQKKCHLVNFAVSEWKEKKTKR